jgi:hypothetical protein
MLNVSAITEELAQNITDWHRGIVIAEPDPPFNFIQENNYWNYQLWHEEDIARRSDIEASRMVIAKRNIDHYNQERNNAMEKIDEWVENWLRSKPKPTSDKMHSETPGMMIDRLSIMSLKKYHMYEEAVRQGATDEHQQKCGEMVSLLAIQIQDLSKCLTDVLIQLEKGALQFRVYRQLKMYNDPMLNPQLYDATNNTPQAQVKK